MTKVINAVQKFVRAYKMVERLKRSSLKQSDTVQAAKKIYRKDNNRDEFCLNHVQQLLKDRAKWFTHKDITGNSSKRATISESRIYTSSSNPESEYNSILPNLVHSQGRKAAKKKGKGKLGKTSSDDVVGKMAEALEKLTNLTKKRST